MSLVSISERYLGKLSDWNVSFIKLLGKIGFKPEESHKSKSTTDVLSQITAKQTLFQSTEKWQSKPPKSKELERQMGGRGRGEVSKIIITKPQKGLLFSCWFPQWGISQSYLQDSSS